MRPGDDPRHQHLLALGDRDRGGGPGAGPGGRHALLQPSGADATGRGRRGRRVLRGGARQDDRSGRANGPHAGAGRRSDRLHRQPLRAALLAGGAAAAGGAGRRPRADRPHLPARRRLSDGAVRAHRPGRDRRQPRRRQLLLGAELPRAALAAAPDPDADGRLGPARPQGRARLLRLRLSSPPPRGPSPPGGHGGGRIRARPRRRGDRHGPASGRCGSSTAASTHSPPARMRSASWPSPTSNRRGWSS